MQEAYNKIVKCINSCTTVSQLSICDNMIVNFDILYEDSNLYRDLTRKSIRKFLELS